METDGTLLGPSTFEECCALFAEAWENTNAGDGSVWSWLTPSRRNGEEHLAAGFLVLERFPIFSSQTDGANRDESLSWEREQEGLLEEYPPLSSRTLQEDSAVDALAASAHDPQRSLKFLDLHIVYSPSYRVPVLYLRCYRSDGKELSWDDFDGILPSKQEKKSQTLETFMSQEEHPHLRRPWFAIHPCQTAELLCLMHQQELLSTSCPQSSYISSHKTAVGNRRSTLLRYMLGWFSVVGAAVGVKLPLEVFRQI
ncbi:hypothetical protein CYMTET_42067 [Cymbomonas tetramitiformis]|uniref:Ubiquitin-like-conjugating enzyme ATG10 n=1 Tax=Cymbomonas tetramitiformis TaxID=36881 RepID=A0AAE0F1W7_9CHLO|nr:hypothetical protein CYMTET_42067 [Cymbomonas tetramitiformis]